MVLRSLISTVLAAAFRRIPPLARLLAERDALRLRIAESDQAAPLSHGGHPINRDKIELIDFAFKRLNLNSFADLGGAWGVDGAYTFHALDHYWPAQAVLVDTHPTSRLHERRGAYPQLRFIQGNFGEQSVAAEVGQVDAVILFDVLLHQVTPDWDQVLATYAARTRCLIIFNQQWVQSTRTVRLLDLGESEYFRNVPHVRTESPYDNLFQKLDQKHPDHERTWRDVHHIWQWGISDADLCARVEALGFRMQFYKNCGRFGTLHNFENHAFVFSK